MIEIMFAGLYAVVGLVLALVNLLEDRHTGEPWYGGDLGQQVVAIFVWILLWPVLVIGWVLYKITREA